MVPTKTYNQQKTERRMEMFLKQNFENKNENIHFFWKFLGI